MIVIAEERYRDEIEAFINEELIPGLHRFEENERLESSQYLPAFQAYAARCEALGLVVVRDRLLYTVEALGSSDRSVASAALILLKKAVGDVNLVYI